jgi:hypothetical protein
MYRFFNLSTQVIKNVTLLTTWYSIWLSSFYWLANNEYLKIDSKEVDPKKPIYFVPSQHQYLNLLPSGNNNNSITPRSK